jgi:DNA-binding response OmpR family regulator
MSGSILLVEDDPTASLALSKILEGAGYRVRSASDGASAIALLERHSFDVVLTDLRLPDTDGISVMRAAQRQVHPPALVLLTGYSTVDTAVAALRLGAHDYLRKPCQPQALLESVASALERNSAQRRQSATLQTLAQTLAQMQNQIKTLEPGAAPAAPEPPAHTPATQDQPLTVGPLELGRMPHETLYDGRPLHLTPMEHTFLRCLAEARGGVVLCTDIVRRTHGYNADAAVAQNLLKSHVRNLRRKIDPDLIVNVRGIGYRLGEEV